MSRISKIGSMIPSNRLASPQRTRKQAARLQRPPSSRRCTPRLEQLEDRITPSISTTTPFELDGNATIQTTHDWNQIFTDAGSPTSGGGDFRNGATSLATAGSFDYDPVNNKNTDIIFTTGGGKDIQPISSWLYKNGSPQDKDDIENIFASAYIDSNNHLILYAGMTRFSNSGDSTAGFWFLQDPNFGTPNSSPPNSGANFSGHHMNGDVLLVSDFSIGGSVPTITVYTWVGDDATGHLSDPLPGNATNTYGIVNSGSPGVSWSFKDKTGNTQPAAGEFLEVGADLTGLGLSGCFSTFVGETRSSTSPTATLSDIAFRSFPLCNVQGTNTLSNSKFDVETQKGDASFIDVGVTNTGAVPLYLKSVTDTAGAQTSLGDLLAEQGTNPPGPVESVSSDLIHNGMIVGSAASGTKLDPGDQVIFHINRTVQAGDPDPTTGSVTFTLTGNSNLTGTSVTADSPWTVNLFQPSATLTLVASPTSAAVGDLITYTYTVHNTSSADSPNLVLDSTNQGPGDPNTFTDSFGDIEADAIHAATGNNTATVASIPPGAMFSFTETHTLQGNGPLTNSATAAFTLVQPTVGTFPNIIHASSQVTVHVVDANISIAPDDVNEVGQPHTFVVTVHQIIDGVSTLASGASVTVKLTGINGAVPDISAPQDLSPANPSSISGTTGSDGTFQVTFSSASAGQVIGNATTTLTVSGVSLTRTTGDGKPGDTGDATKRFVDAKISITPNATNGITEPHTFTVTVMQDDGFSAAQGGDGVTGFGPAAGASVTVTLTNSGGAVANPAGPFTSTTDSNGQFTVTFTSNSAGTVTGHAAADVVFSAATGDVTVHRETDSTHGSSGDAVKTFVAGSLRWLKIDADTGLALGGATFVVTATGGTAASRSPTSVTVVDNVGDPTYTGFDADPAPGKFLLKPFQSFGGSALVGLAMGDYKVHESVAPPGYTLDPNDQTATLTTSSPDADLSSTPFMDTLPHLTITKTVGVNGINDGTSEVIKPGDIASFTITVSNTGLGTATNVLLTDPLPTDNGLLTWTVTQNYGTPILLDGYDMATIDASGNLTANKSALLGNTSVTIVVSALIPANLFGTTGSGNGDPVPLDLFELDANAKTGDLTSGGGGPSKTASHDWDQVYADAGKPQPPSGSGDFTTTGTQSGASSGSFAYDPVNGNDNIFAAGGSKDISGIQQGPWLSTTGKPQGKDDIENAFAALYKTSNGDEVLYAGATRFDNSGDATLGFWFFQNSVSSTAGKSQHFTGTHTDGDFLIIADFSIGGSVSTPTIYKWVGDDATGSLSGPLTAPLGTADAVVNGLNVTLPWTFTNKSKVGGNTALPGEFLELGINLTGVGLNSCVGSFLAETRSSTSTSATLSDFVIGKFPTCILVLPNKATVSADHIDPITSNTATITVTPTGKAQMPTAPGSGAGTALLTDQELQSVVGQAIDQWRAAGVDPAQLSTLAQVPIHVADITWGWLGLTTQGEIWIDRTADGWGWSTGSTPEAGRMDLLTVVTHEYGHILGFGPTDTGVMETTLGPGVQRVPEALTHSATVGVPGTSAAGSFSVGVPATTSTAVSRTAEPARVPQTSPSHTETVEASFVTTGRDVSLSTAAGAIQNGTGILRNLAGVLVNPGQQSPLVLSAVVADSVLGPAGVGRDFSSILVPGLWPPLPRLESGSDMVLPSDEAQDADPAEWLLPRAKPSDTPLDLGADAQTGLGLRQQAFDACFADGSWQAEPVAAEESASAPDAVAASAALALVLGSYWSAPRTETERRMRQRFPR